MKISFNSILINISPIRACPGWALRRPNEDWSLRAVSFSISPTMRHNQHELHRHEKCRRRSPRSGRGETRLQKEGKADILIQNLSSVSEFVLRDSRDSRPVPVSLQRLVRVDACCALRFRWAFSSSKRCAHGVTCCLYNVALNA